MSGGRRMPSSSLSAQVNQMLSSQQQMLAAFQALTSAATVIDDPLRPPPKEAQFDPSQPDTLGWRCWLFFPEGRSAVFPDGQGWSVNVTGPILISPHMHTPWESPELHVRQPWDDSEIVRGQAGIHARLMPFDWRKAGWPYLGQKEGPELDDQLLVTGVVERFGRYVLGSMGWRAEWVIIRALMAPTTEVGLALEQKYPDVPVYYPEESRHGHR